jgi:hypothetical protein
MRGKKERRQRGERKEERSIGEKEDLRRRC